MNSTIPQRVIDEAFASDPARAAAEYGGEFRDDLVAFISRDLVDAATDIGITVRPPQPDIRYHAFADPSGGAGDSFTLAIAHLDGDGAVLDCLFERRSPFNPSAVIAEITDLCREYRVGTVTGDRYASGFTVDAFTTHGFAYQHSLRDKSQIYVDVLPLFSSGRVRLLDHPRLAGQLTSLERRASPGGRDRIDHPPGAHDDLANAAAGALTLAARKSQQALIAMPIVVTASRDNPAFSPVGDTYSAYLPSIGR